MAHERREEKRRELLNKLLINRETSVLNTVINTERIIKTISFRREHFQLLRNFTDKAKLERSNFQAKDGFSELAIKAFTEYMQHHPLPNPQLTLERSLNLGMPAKKSSQCCVSNCQKSTVPTDSKRLWRKARSLPRLRNSQKMEAQTLPFHWINQKVGALRFPWSL